MSHESFSIPNISCGHCVNAIESELRNLAGVQSVKGNTDSRRVAVSWDPPATREAILETLAEINYPAE